MSRIRSGIIYFTDLLFRTRNFTRRRIFGYGVFSNKDSESDSQATFYVQAVSKINRVPRQFLRFRRIFDYREILEHVSFNQGMAYLQRIEEIDPKHIVEIAEYLQNDGIGKPFRYRFPLIGKASPTTLRYVSVMAEIKRIFGNNLSGDFVEIGVGYGGQFLILDKSFKIKSYSMFDLIPVLNLTEKYLEHFEYFANVKFLALDEDFSYEWDLAVSNYAFSELPKSLQREYIGKVLSRSKRGYLIMNSGLEDLTGRSSGKLTLSELREALPSFEIIEEIPLTSPDNYIIVWGHK